MEYFERHSMVYKLWIRTIEKNASIEVNISFTRDILILPIIDYLSELVLVSYSTLTGF